MLSSRLTMDDEDAVQAELKELQTEAVSRTVFCLIPLADLYTTAPRDGKTTYQSPIRSNDRAYFVCGFAQ